MKATLLLLLLFPPAAAAADPCAGVSTQAVTLVHVTDLHARYQPGPDGVSPYARIRGYFNSVLAQAPGALLLDGGDDHEKGSLADLLSGGLATDDVVRAMRFDARTLGNHDFAWGEAAVRDYLRDPSGPVLGSNLTPVRRSTEPAPVYFAVRQAGCVRVGFFGLAAMPWNAADEPYPGDYPGFRAEHDYIAAARRVLRAAAGQADIMVMLSHLGNADDLSVARSVDGIDLVLGGHTHAWTWTPVKAGGAVFAETGPYAEFLTRVDLVYDLKARKVLSVGHELLRVGASMPADPAVQRAVEAALRKNAPEAGLRVSCALRDASPATAAAAAAGAVLGLGLADAAVADSGSVWKLWKAGPLTPQDLVDAFAVERQPPGTPGISAFYAVGVSGADLAAVAARADGKRWAYAGPSAPAKDRRYLLALPKRVLALPGGLLPAGMPLKDPVYLMEAWEALHRWSRARGSALCIDAPAPPAGR
jgi:hypothetical protein